MVAALGILGVVGFMVATRTREVAVRMALGSTRRRVFRLMLSDTLGTEPLGVMEPVIYAGPSLLALTVD